MASKRKKTKPKESKAVLVAFELNGLRRQRNALRLENEELLQSVQVLREVASRSVRSLTRLTAVGMKVLRVRVVRQSLDLLRRGTGSGTDEAAFLELERLLSAGEAPLPAPSPDALDLVDRQLAAMVFSEMLTSEQCEAVMKVVSGALSRPDFTPARRL